MYTGSDYKCIIQRWWSVPAQYVKPKSSILFILLSLMAWELYRDNLNYFMQSLKLQSPWAEVKEKLKEININLTDEDLAYQEGNEEALIQRLQHKIGKSREDTIGLIESVSSNKGKAG